MSTGSGVAAKEGAPPPETIAELTTGSWALAVTSTGISRVTMPPGGRTAVPVQLNGPPGLQENPSETVIPRRWSSRPAGRVSVIVIGVPSLEAPPLLVTVTRKLSAPELSPGEKFVGARADVIVQAGAAAVAVALDVTLRNPASANMIASVDRGWRPLSVHLIHVRLSTFVLPLPLRLRCQMDGYDRRCTRRRNVGEPYFEMQPTPMLEPSPLAIRQVESQRVGAGLVNAACARA